MEHGTTTECSRIVNEHAKYDYINVPLLVDTVIESNYKITAVSYVILYEQPEKERKEKYFGFPNYCTSM